MLLSRAAKKFDTNTYDGYDGTKWDLGVVKGSLEAFSRFISDRESTMVRRNVACSERIPSKYSMLRSNNGTIYIIGYGVEDSVRDTTVGFIYTLQDALHLADIVTFTKTTSASGMGSEVVESKVLEVPCYVQRTSSEKAGDDLSFVVFSKYRAVFPSHVTLPVGGELEVGGIRYTIKETDTKLNMKRAYITEK